MQFLSGVVNGCTTGTAIALMIENQNTRSGDYAKTADLLRPGHADYTAYAKYHGYQDARGGGHFSGRVTAALVAGGAIVLSALHRAGHRHHHPYRRCAGISDTRFALDDPAALAAQAEALLTSPRALPCWTPQCGGTHEGCHPRRRCRGRQCGRRAGDRHSGPARRGGRAVLRQCGEQARSPGLLHPGGQGHRVRFRVRLCGAAGLRGQRRLPHDAGGGRGHRQQPQRRHQRRHLQRHARGVPHRVKPTPSIYKHAGHRGLPR